MVSRIVVICNFLVLLFINTHAAPSTPTTAIPGFINRGTTGAEVNTLLTRSFHTFFSRLPGARVVPAATAEKLAADKKLLSGTTVNRELAVQVGQMLGARIVVTGTYSVNDEKQTIDIEILALDTATAEVRFQRRYTGKAGPALLDTIETVRKSAAGMMVGQEIAMTTVQVVVKDTAEPYQVLVGGQLEGLAGPLFERQYAAGVVLPLALMRQNSTTEVYRTNLSLEAGKPVRVEYSPSARILIQSAIIPVDLYREGRLAASLSDSSPFDLGSLSAGREYRVLLKNRDWQTSERTIRPAEGLPLVIGFDTNDFYPRISYSGLVPALNMLLPPLVQFQAHDYTPALVFTGFTLADAAVLGICLAGFIQADQIVSTHYDTGYRETVRPYRDAYLYGMIGAGVGWLLIGGASWLHAGLCQASEQESVRVSGMVSPDGSGLVMTMRF